MSSYTENLEIISVLPVEKNLDINLDIYVRDRVEEWEAEKARPKHLQSLKQKHNWSPHNTYL